MKKVLLLLIIIIFMFVPLFQSTYSVNALLMNQGSDIAAGRNNYKNYWNCTISSKNGNVDHRAFLFPGFWYSGTWSSSGPGVEVKRASGILIGDGTDFTYPIYFNDDHYYTNWKIAFVFSFTGYFSNYWDRPGVRVFEIQGTATFVRVYYS